METIENDNQVVVDNDDKQCEDAKPGIGYLSHEGFTSEIFKIEIKSLPKYYGFSEIKKLVNVTLKLDSNKIKIPGRNSNFAFVCFKCEEGKKTRYDPKSIIIQSSTSIFINRSSCCFEGP